MKKVLWWVVPVLLVAAGALAYWKYGSGPKTPQIEYRTATVEKKRIVGRVTASGTVQAVVTVQVGSQVSGRVSKLFADFNSTVKKGQLVAKIDPQIFQAAVSQASANHRAAKAQVAQAEAQASNAEKQYTRTKELFAQGLVSQIDVDTAQTSAAVARAQVDSAKAGADQARAALNRAQVDLSYTDIASPIDGVVISRSVDVGQTVAASLSAPVIFTIAEDLKKMQVNTSVSEGDVGRLAEGMGSFFTVDAFPGQRFRGKIGQIRNAATTVQNVVTYNALIDVDNDDLKLRPGMTANVTIIYAEKEGALSVPNQALRFRPPPEVSGTASASGGPGSGAGAGTGRGQRGGRGSATALADDVGSGSAAPAGSGSAAAGSGSAAAGSAAPAGTWRPRGEQGPSDARTVWVLRDGKGQAVQITVGLSDGTTTEVTGGELKEGDLVITDATVTGGASTAAAGAAPGAGAMPRRMF